MGVECRVSHLDEVVHLLLADAVSYTAASTEAVTTTQVEFYGTGGTSTPAVSSVQSNEGTYFIEPLVLLVLALQSRLPTSLVCLQLSWCSTPRPWLPSSKHKSSPLSLQQSLYSFSRLSCIRTLLLTSLPI